MEEKEKDMVTPEEEAEKFVSGQEGSENETVEESGKTAEDGGQAGCRETGEKAESEPGGTESDGPEETKKEKETAGQEKAGRDKEKKVFGRKNKEDKKTEALNEKIGELEDKVKRQLAEFENFRRSEERRVGKECGS